RNTGQIEALAGCDRLTISPPLLEALNSDQAELPRQLGQANGAENKIGYDDAGFRWAMNADAMATEKLAEGIRNFAADQIKLEQLVSSL
ncbi:MAG: transaldolase, partial [Pseudomonadales bacterium]|nr:transaldolase [Pseudomonadales bacterium]